MYLLSTFSVSGTVICAEITLMNKKDTVFVLRGPTVYEGIRQVNGKMPFSGVKPSDGGSGRGEGTEEEA